MTALALVALAVLTISAFASVTEAAIFLVSYAKARAMAKAKKRGAKALVKVKYSMSRSIGTVVIVDNIADIVGSALVGAIASDLLDSMALGVFFAVFTFIAIIGAKIVPKTFGEAHAERIAPLMAPGVLLMTRVLSPMLWIVEKILDALRHRRGPVSVSEEEIKMMALLGRESGSVEPDESRLIRQVFKLNDITADDMMTPADRVESIPGDAALGDRRRRILDLRHSRVPVCGDAPDQILGVAMTRDLISAIARDEFAATPADFLQEALRVANDMPADDLLPLFQQKEQHLAVVEDRDGRMVGVVTLEDVLEELVGEITDEKDVRPETIKRVSKNEILVDEGTDVARINHFFNVSIAYEGTIGDYVMEKFGRRPKAGETVEDGGLTHTIAGMSRTRPKLIGIIKNA